MNLFPIDKLGAAFAVVALLILFSLLRWQRDKSRPEFDLTDLLMENGRLSKISCVMMGSFFVTTWMMVYMTLHAHMSEGYLTIYVGAWIAPVVARIVKGTPESGKEDSVKPVKPEA